MRRGHCPMSKIAFSSIEHGFGIAIVSDEVDGHVVAGQYDGVLIRAAVPLNEGDNCVLLLDPNGTEKYKSENLLCVARSGQMIWRAHLEDKLDAFSHVRIGPEGVWANTWSGWFI